MSTNDRAERIARAIMSQYIVQDEFEFEPVPLDELAEVIRGEFGDDEEDSECPPA